MQNSFDSIEYLYQNVISTTFYLLDRNSKCWRLEGLFNCKQIKKCSKPLIKWNSVIIDSLRKVISCRNEELFSWWVFLHPSQNVTNEVRGSIVNYKSSEQQLQIAAAISSFQPLSSLDKLCWISSLSSPEGLNQREMEKSFALTTVNLKLWSILWTRIRRNCCQRNTDPPHHQVSFS